MGEVSAVLLGPASALLDPGRRVFWPFLLGAALIGIVVTLGHGVAPRHLARRLLAPRVWLHPSARLDYQLLLVKALLRGLGLGALGLSMIGVATAVAGSLRRSMGPVALSLSPAAAGALLTFAVFLAEDYSRFFVHRLMHRSPLLWAFHRVHHSAEALTPFTLYRTHPVEALLNASIFFDFRSLFGKAELADAMRRHLLAQAAATPMFLQAMSRIALDVEPPLGKIRDFLTDLEPDHPGKIDLKKYGSRIFVDVARIYALATGVHNTNSAQRLRLSGKRLSIRDEEINAVLEGLDFIQLLRLRHQYLEGEPGRQGDNLISPDDLNELDRRILKESFRQARKIQTRLKLDYQVS